MLIGNKRDEVRLVLYRSFFALSYHVIAHPGKVLFIRCTFFLIYPGTGMFWRVNWRVFVHSGVTIEWAIG